MAYTYSDWRTYSDSDPAAKLARLRLHIVEVSDLITADVTKGGSSRSVASLSTYLATLEKSESKYAALTAQKNGSRAYAVNMNGSRP